jgi:asparagine synthase (glutamine-hydrolysing)
MGLEGFLVTAGRGTAYDRVTSQVDLHGLAEQYPQEHRVDDVVIRWRGERTTLAATEHHVVLLCGDIDETRPALPTAEAGEDAARLFLRAWRHWGGLAVDRLVGPWAAVVYERDTRTLHVARDITAGAPAYVWGRGETAAAGSDLWDVARISGRSRSPEPLFLASYLQGAFFDAKITPFSSVLAVAPGSLAQLGTHGWQQHQQAVWHVPRVRVATIDDATDLVERHLDVAVAARVRGRRRVAVSLSGGLDSTNVLASLVRAAEGSDLDIRALGMPFYTPQGDERAGQVAVAKHLGVPLEWVDVSAGGPLTGMGTEFLHRRHWPPLAGNWFFTEALAQRAEESGVEAILDGEDADGSFGGDLVYLPDLFLRGQWKSWWQEAQLLRPQGWGLRKTARYTVSSLLPPAVDWRLTGRPRALEPAPIVASALRESTALVDRLAAQPVVRLWAPGRRFRAAQGLAGQPAQVGAVAVESSGGSVGRSVSMLHPFMDRRVMELAMGMPWWALTTGGEVKRVIRELARRRLPPGFADTVRKAHLGEYYEAALAGPERPRLLEGLQQAARRPDVFAPGEVARLKRGLDSDGGAWEASRVAILATWLATLD